MLQAAVQACCTTSLLFSTVVTHSVCDAQTDFPCITQSAVTDRLLQAQLFKGGNWAILTGHLQTWSTGLICWSLQTQTEFCIHALNFRNQKLILASAFTKYSISSGCNTTNNLKILFKHGAAVKSHQTWIKCFVSLCLIPLDKMSYYQNRSLRQVNTHTSSFWDFQFSNI